MKKTKFYVVTIIRNKRSIDKYYRADFDNADCIEKNAKFMWPEAKVVTTEEEVDIDDK